MEEWRRVGYGKGGPAIYSSAIYRPSGLLLDHWYVSTFSQRIISNIIIDNDRRNQYAKLINDHGGAISEELNRNVTVLVASRMESQKCGYAKRWRIPIVRPNWLHDSFDAYAPLPVDDYLIAKRKAPPSYRKVDLQASVLPENYYNLSVSSISQKYVAAPKRKAMNEQWENNLKSFQAPKRRRQTATENMWNDQPATTEKTNTDPDFAPVSHSETASASPSPQILENDLSNGIFQDSFFYLHGFDKKQAEILNDCILSNSGIICSELNDPKLTHVILYSLLNPREIQNFGNLPTIAAVKTEWFIERSLDKKEPLDDDWGMFIRHRNLPQFKGLKISISGFTGSDRLHVHRLIEILGAEHHDVFTPEVNALIATPGAAKEVYAKHWKIPMFRISWLWECAKTGKVPLKAINGFSLEKSSKFADENLKGRRPGSMSGWVEIINSKNADDSVTENQTSPNKRLKLVGRAQISTMSSSAESSCHEDNSAHSSHSESRELNQATPQGPQIKYCDRQSIRERQALFDELGEKAGDKGSILLTQETAHAEDCLNSKAYMRHRY